MVGNLSRKVGKTFMRDGTDIKANMHEGMAVINAPQPPADNPLLIKRAIASLSDFVKKQESNRSPSVTFSDRGPDGKLMIFYNFRRSDEMVQMPNGKYKHEEYADAKGVKAVHTHVNFHYQPNISNTIAALPNDTADFFIMYLKGLAQLFECPTDEIFSWSSMLLDYSVDGGFSSHTDGIKAFNNQAGFVVLLSLSDIDDQAKSFDLIPTWTLSKNRPIRITTKGYEGILMTGLARVDQPHSIPFENGRRGRTWAIKMPFVASESPYIRMLHSELSGVDVQLFDAAMAIEGGAKVPAKELAFSASAQEFSPVAFSASAQEFSPLSASAQEFSLMTLSASAQVFTPK
jgi:hypothetical protein